MAADERKRVAFVVNRFHPFIGGIENYSLNFVRGLRRKGFEVTVLTVVPPHMKFPRNVDDGLEVIRFRDMSPVLPDLSLGLAAHLISKINSYDLLIVNGYHSTLSLEAVMLSASRFVFVSHFHGLVGKNEWRTAVHRYYGPIGSLIVRRASRIVCASEHEAALVMETFPKARGKTVVIPEGVNGFDCGKWQRHRRALITVSRLEKYKGVQYIVNSMKYLPGYVLHVVGEGPYLSPLKALVEELGMSDRVTFHGKVDEESKHQLLCSSSVFVLLSTQEAYGLSVAEALAAGLPAVVPGKGALAEWVDGVSCVAVREPADAPALASAIRSVEGARVERQLPTWDDYTRAFVENALRV